MVALYKAGTVNHAMNNETAKSMFAPYQAGMVNHAMMNKKVKITDTIFVWHMYWAPSTIPMKNCMFGWTDSLQDTEGSYSAIHVVTVYHEA